MSTAHIQQLIEKALPGSTVAIRDFTGTGDHLEANVVWSGFEGMSRVQQHRKVYEVINHLVGDGRPVHAITMKTWAKAPESLANPADAYFGG